MSNFDKKEYDRIYIKNNIKKVELAMSKDEYESFCAYCDKINMQKATYLKILVDNDAISRGYTAIFGKDKRFKK